MESIGKKSSQVNSLRFFAYDAPIGQHPREKEREIYVKRKDHLTRKSKLIPDMYIPITHGRKPIPAHQLMEDDWRAFRSAAHFQARMAAVHAATQSKIGAKGEMGAMGGMGKRPTFPVYDSNLPALGGFLYSHHKACLEMHKRKTARTPRQAVPTTVFAGPFQSVINVADCGKTKRLLQRDRVRFNPSCLMLRTYDAESARQMRIYNEPDVIARESLKSCFSDGNLMIRAMKQSHLLKKTAEEITNKTKIVTNNE